MSVLSVVSFTSRAAAVVAVFAGVAACAPPAAQQSATVSTPGAPSASLASTPVLLACPAGQQPLMRQVVVNGTLVPQVECVSTTPVAPLLPAAYGAGAVVPTGVPAQTYTPAAYQTYAPAAAIPVATRNTASPRARRAVYDDDVVEYRRPARRTWQKSAVIIGSAAGIGAGVGAVTKGKKGALIGAAIGGGAATVWDQVTRRQPR